MTLEELDALPELTSTPWPFRGHKDFRNFTQDDYDNIVVGVFRKVDDPESCRWLGGVARVYAAREKLISLGFTVTAERSVALGGRCWDLKWRMPV